MKTRFRLKRRLFRRPLVVLQVEDERVGSGSFGGFIEVWRSSFWRDARAEDVMNGEKT